MDAVATISGSRPGPAAGALPQCYRVAIEGCAQTYRCGADETLLAGMARLGRRGIPVGCRGGGCGVCLVQILDGAYEALAMSREHVSAADLAAGRVLACRVRPRSDLRLKVLGRMERPFFGNTSPSQ